MIQFWIKKRNRWCLKSSALLLAGVLLFSYLAPPIAFARSIEKREHSHYQMRAQSRLFGDPKEARRLLLKESLPQENPEIASSLIHQLFVAPWKEALDTFDPVKFFLDHSERSLSQIIGISLIWGGMIATAIGAPFGLDWLISGSPTANLYTDLLGSALGITSLVAGVMELRLKRIPSRVEELFFSLKYYLYPTNIATHSFLNLVFRIFKQATLTKARPGEDQYQWITREQGIENVRDAIHKNRPDLLEEYEELNNFPPRERERAKESLRDKIYRIKFGHFQIWGLGGAVAQQYAPYFHGSYIAALMTVFPDLNLNPLGFQLKWENENGEPDINIGIESVKFVLSREVPHIMQQYAKLDQLDDRERDDLRNALYGIKQGHFIVWGLGETLHQHYFNGRYADTLMAVFPDLNLNPLGFELKWKNVNGEPDINIGIESVKFVLSREVPHIMHSYKRIEQLTDKQIRDLRNDIHGITSGNFKVWGLGQASIQHYFHGSYKNTLISVFNHPRLGLTLQGFENYRKVTLERKYSWKTFESGIWSVREGIRSNMPDIITRYENLAQLTEEDIERLKRDIYGITAGYFNIWGLGGALVRRQAPYFQGSHINILIAVFSNLNLNPLGFQLKWGNEDGEPDINIGIESVRYVLSKVKPHLIEQYDNRYHLNPRHIAHLRNEIYGITVGHFYIWGLGGAMREELAPYFHGKYMDALMAVFPDLNLNPLGFQLDWSSEDQGIESLKFVLSREVPNIMQKYARLNELNDNEIRDLRNAIYLINQGHFHIWGLGAVKDRRHASYFYGSYIDALLKVFPHPRLGLTREGFLERVDNASAALVTRATRSEAFKRGMHPDGWISQLFFAPHYEFLDTFDPVQFFKSHNEQTVGQVIGIVLIWGAMVATMIGAPFGIDYLLSGNPTTHLGITLLTSAIGALSILSGIILNRKEVLGQQFKQNRDGFNTPKHGLIQLEKLIHSHSSLNRTQRFILSIVYLSYPPNFVAHHLYNLISNLTRLLGKWRLAPLTKARVGEEPYQWGTREQGIANVRDAILKNRPDLLERYEELEHLPATQREYAEESLRDDIYKITSGHFQVWGLYKAMDQESAPYFHGKHSEALMAVFHDLNLNPLGFGLKWGNETGEPDINVGIESVKFVLSREVPYIMQKYAKFDQLNDREIHDLKNEIYEIKEGHFQLWELSGAMDQRTSPYFHGTYINVLIAVFTDLNLNPLGFGLKWGNETGEPDINVGIESVKFVLSREVPQIMQQYEKLDQLDDRQINNLRNAIYGITFGHLKLWGLNRGMNQRAFPYFNGSYKNALISVFNHPRLGLTLQGFSDYRRATFERRYSWANQESGIWNVREGIRSNRPDIIERYENLTNLSEGEIEGLKRDIYGITSGHFKVWGLSGAMAQQAAPYFHGSYTHALMAVFPDLNLNPLGFELKWKNENGEPDINVGVESVRYVLSKVRPHLIEQYDNRHHLNPKHLVHLRNEIYRITPGHFNEWGLGGAINHQSAPYFHGKHSEALMAVFHDLNLNPFGFGLKWGNETGEPDINVGIESVKFVLSREVPQITQRYERLDQSDDSEQDNLRNDIYKITYGHFKLWGLSGAMNHQSAPYFHGTYINVLMAVFPDLNLNPLGFQLKWGNETGEPDINVGIESVKFILSREVPQIMQQYERLDQLDDSERDNLRNDIYGIRHGHFQVWGLGLALHKRLVPYFNGNYIVILLKVFNHPRLGLTREGFSHRAGNGGSSLMAEATRTESVRRGMNPDGWISQLFFAPHYEFLDTFDPVQFFKSHKEQTVGQVIGILLIWGAMVATMIGAPFGIDYLLSGNPTTHLGITFLTSAIGALSILSGIRLNQIQDGHNFNRLERIILSITYLSYPPNFLAHNLYNLLSNFTRNLGKWRVAPLTKGITVYRWEEEENGIENVRDAISKNRPDLIERYEKLHHLSERERSQAEEILKNDIYKITDGHFMVWGLSSVTDQRRVPYFHGSYTDALKAVFPDLNLDPLGFHLDWSTSKKGMESVKFVLSREIPHIVQQYEKIDQLTDRDIHDLRDEIYAITSAHFKVWGLNTVMNSEKAPYFHGTFIHALMEMFPRLNLNSLGFKLKWRNENGEPELNVGIESVKFVLSQEVPHIVQQYERLDELTDREIQNLRNAIYAIKSGHFQLWGLSNAMDIQKAPYFQGSYMNVLISVFNHRRLGLTLQGFRDYRKATLEKIYSWKTPESGIFSVREGIRSNRPDIIERYENLAQLNEREVEGLRADIYKIGYGHFQTWGLGAALNLGTAPYFQGSHITALMELFPNLHLDPLGFGLKWRNDLGEPDINLGIKSVRYVLSKVKPHLIEQYDNRDHLNPRTLVHLRDEIYKINYGYFNLWGLSAALHQKLAPYFHGSYIHALRALFPDLHLDPLGFELMWENENGEPDINMGIKSVRFVLSREIPHIMQQYARLDELSEPEIDELKNKIYGITNAHFKVWGLSAALHLNQTPYFHGSYNHALMAVFPDLHLNPLGFELDWSNEEKGIESVRFVLLREVPHIMQQYERIAHLTENKIHDLKNEIYSIKRADFNTWKLEEALSSRSCPYFNSSHIDALLKIFSHPKLALTRERFLKKSGNGNHPPALTTESTRSEAVKRGMNPNSWISQLFFAPHYEFLDTFDPVRFFKSHKEQTVGQVIGIVLIWGAMVATMIGAPFGIDYLLSGNPTTHLGITLLVSAIGALSILSGIILNQKEVLGQQFIFAIAYLSYPPNFLAHHLYNLISNLTLSFGNWRLMPLIKARAGEELYQWATREQGVANVRDAIRKNRPDLLERYEELEHLPATQRKYAEESLRDKIYRIKQGHFNVWGLDSAMNQRLAPYFHGSFINVLIAAFPDLNLNPLGFELKWENEDRKPDINVGIESVKFVLTREVPHIMQKYAKFDQLNDREIHDLKNAIYEIKEGHFQLWGLSGAMNQQVAPYFHGSYTHALMAAFPNLNLNPLGFQFQWENENGEPDINLGIESLKFVLAREIPHIMQLYERNNSLTDTDIRYLRNAIYGIKQGHFAVWGLSAVKNQESALYFHGSYMNALISVFNHPKLGLTVQGFKDYRKATYEQKYSWGIRDSGIWSVREGIRSNRPDIIERYENLADLNEGEIEGLKRDIYGITSGHFQLWGLGGAMNRQVAPYFNGSYINALISVFPDLNLNPLGFQLDWSSKEKGIESIRFVLSKVRPHLIEQYDNRHHINPRHIEHLRNEIYGISKGHFKVWGLSSAMNQQVTPYFNGSYINTLMVVFPDLNLNSLGFRVKWENEDGEPDINVGIESVRYVLTREVPHIMQEYVKKGQLTKKEIIDLRYKIYKITQAHFRVWGLKTVMNQQIAPYFHGSYINALMAVFLDLHLNPLGFELKWRNKDGELDINVGIESLKFVFSKEVPDIMQQYAKVGKLTGSEIKDLRNKIYEITARHFKVWGLGAAINQQSVPYFNASHIDALLNVFNHPRLGLTREGFSERAGNRNASLMAEATRSEAVKRGMNPDGWITQLFFAPHYEFLDTFDPVQFFKSHKVQTVGQAIGIVLIWGVMVATMIGAPFGIDYLLSGNPTTHLVISLISSVIGAFSILSGIILNQIKEKEVQFNKFETNRETVNELRQDREKINSLIQSASYLKELVQNHNFNRIQKFIFSIAYLSYPVNFLTHHFYNLISNLTRLLGKWRLAPLTKISIEGGRYQWRTRDEGIENVRNALTKYRPDLLERYENLTLLPPGEREFSEKVIKKKIYAITSGHFRIWNLDRAMKQTYFEGSYIGALSAIFPDLNLNPLGFKLDWSTKERGIESIKFVLDQEMPHIMQQYHNINLLSQNEIQNLREEVYKIGMAHFMAWGLNAALHRRTAPYFNGSYSEALMSVFSDLNLNPLGFRLKWSSMDQRIESVNFVFTREIPHIMQEYARINQLSDREIHDLKNEIYRITKGHFELWGIQNSNKGSDFDSYQSVLLAVFSDPRLDLSIQGFKDYRKAVYDRKYNWGSYESGIWNVRDAIRNNRSDIIERYENYSLLKEEEKINLKKDIYEISHGHFSIWGLSRAMNRESAPYFHGSHIDALIATFPDLDLNPLEFQLDWSSRERCIESVRHVLSKVRPDMIKLYDNRKNINPKILRNLVEEIYEITQGHFQIWGLGSAMSDIAGPYFNRSHIQALMAVFQDINLNPLGFRSDWSTMEIGIESAKFIFEREIPQIMQRYRSLEELDEAEIQNLKSEIYSITKGNFEVWGLSTIGDSRKVPYFEGSFIKALITIFSKLNLHPLDFQLDWSSEENSIESVRYVFSKYAPHILNGYDHLDELTEAEIQKLKEQIYEIDNAQFNEWGLSAARYAPYFNGGYVSVLVKVFSKLNFNPLQFYLIWSSENTAIESVKFALNKNIPQIMQLYERIEELTPDEISALRIQIYKIKSDDFNEWGLGAALIRKNAPYFHGSYIDALLKVFNHPKLGLTREGFLKKAGNGNASLMAEATRTEALKRGMNPDGWISQLFFAPHYEFLDTFAPVQFFKSHKEKTVSQAIGILFIWGAMVATMIGAPFGIDYFLSGNPTTHLVVTLFTSAIGALSILSGIILNRKEVLGQQFNQNRDGFNTPIHGPIQLEKFVHSHSSLNRTERFILAIAYLSYPPNFLAHHIYNFISNFTRLLGKWRLAPLIKARVGEEPYQWGTREQGIANMRDGIRRNRPDLLERYEKLSRLSLIEKEHEEESLRNEIYGITLGHFDVWGLSRAKHQRLAPYFHGKYSEALMAVFHDLNLNPLGFGLEWKNDDGESDINAGIESVRYVLSREVPHIMQQYARLDQLTDREVYDLKNRIYAIKQGHFQLWGLGAARSQRLAHYFHGSYIVALLKVFSDPRLGLTREGFFGQFNNLITDILEPLVRPEERLSIWWLKAPYYFFVSGWEELVFRWGTLIWLLIYLSSFGADPIFSQIPGVILSTAGFLFSHTIVRWIVKRNSSSWLGWKLELKKDLLSSRTSFTLIYNILFLSVLLFHPASLTPALSAVVILHFIKDMTDSYSKHKTHDYKELLAQTINKIAKQLNTSQDELNRLIAFSHYKFSNLIQSLSSTWSKETPSPKLYIIDLSGTKDSRSQVALIRILKELNQKSNYSSVQNRYLLVSETNHTIQELEQILSVQGILAVAADPQVAAQLVRNIMRKNSYQLRVVATSFQWSQWTKVMAQFKDLFKDTQALILQILDVGSEIKIVLPNQISNAMEEWVSDLEETGRARRIENELTIEGVEVEPPTHQEERQIQELFNSQA